MANTEGKVEYMWFIRRNHVKEYIILCSLFLSFYVAHLNPVVSESFDTREWFTGIGELSIWAYDGALIIIINVGVLRMILINCLNVFKEKIENAYLICNHIFTCRNAAHKPEVQLGEKLKLGYLPLCTL